MLSISMKAGEYFTVGGSTVVQYDHLRGERVYLTVDAPREVAILRGKVLERGGGERPECVREVSARYVRQLPWSREKKQALRALRDALERMEDGPEVREVRAALERIFPSTP